MFCVNPQCQYKTFSELFDFVLSGGKKTKRLTENILIISAKLSSVKTSKLLAANSICASKSSICDLLKKMPALVDKTLVTKVCIVFSHKCAGPVIRMETAEKFKIDELDTYFIGLCSDLVAVKNGIEQKYNNGLAEGSVSKIN